MSGYFLKSGIMFVKPIFFHLFHQMVHFQFNNGTNTNREHNNAAITSPNLHQNVCSSLMIQQKLESKEEKNLEAKKD